jgi:hypothetical protein
VGRRRFLLGLFFSQQDRQLVAAKADLPLLWPA